MSVMYIYLSLCEYPRSEVTSGNEGFGKATLYSRYYVTLGVESPRGSGKPDRHFVILAVFCMPPK